MKSRDRKRSYLFITPHKINGDLTSTYNSKIILVDTNYDEEDDFPKYQLSTTYDEENDETKDPIDQPKPSPISASKIETALPSPISAAPTVAIKSPV